jgi:hypothetical protein
VRGDVLESPAALPVSDPPSGIWTVKRGPRGRAEPLRLLDRDGGVNVVSDADDSDTVRGLVWVLDRFRGGETVSPLRLTDAKSTDDARFAAALAATSALLMPGSSNEARCCDRMERFSSMGVKMLCPRRWSFLMVMSFVLSKSDCACGGRSPSSLDPIGGGGKGSRRSGCGGGEM